MTAVREWECPGEDGGAVGWCHSALKFKSLLSGCVSAVRYGALVIDLFARPALFGGKYGEYAFEYVLWLVL